MTAVLRRTPSAVGSAGPQAALNDTPAGAPAPVEPQQLFRLEELPPDALARVMQNLSVRDIHSALLASKSLYSALQDERVWYGLCMTCWGKHTDPHRWLVPPVPAGPGTPSRSILPPPQTYRELYMLLHASAPIVGLWRLQGEGPRSALIRFFFERDGIKGQEVECCAPLTGKADGSLWARISPARGLTTAVSVECEGRATVTVYGAQGQRMHKSPSAEAAAAVALPLSQASPTPLGTSPQGSFEHELLQFMQHSVQSRSTKQRRRSQRGLGQVRPEGPSVYHLKRLEDLQPSSKHPFCGFWAADFGPQGLEILQVSYNFEGKAAQLQGTKVTGDECVPAGKCSWRCLAAPMAVPWPAAEQELVQQQEERWLQEREWWDDDDEEEEEEGEEEGEEPQRGSDDGSDDSSSLAGSSSSSLLPPALTAARAAAAAAKAPPRVVGIHEGSGQVAGPGFTHPEWVSGRLLVLADGSLSFVWGEGLNQVTEMKRLRLPES